MPNATGEKITFSSSNKIQVPNFPIIPFIEGDVGRLNSCFRLAVEPSKRMGA